jgi:hypothetical protein
MKNINKKLFLRKDNHFYVFLFFFFLFLYFTYLFRSVYLLPIWDFLDGEFTYREIRKYHSSVFNLEKTIPILLETYKLNFISPGEFHFQTLIESIFSIRTSTLLISLISRVGILIFTYLSIYKITSSKISSLVAANFAAVTDFWPQFSLNILIASYFVYLLVKLYVDQNKFNNYETFVVVASSFAIVINFGGTFVFALGLFLIWKSKFTTLYKYAIQLIYILFYGISNYRLLFQIFIDGGTTKNVAVEVLNFENINQFLYRFFLVNIQGEPYSFVTARYFLGIAIILYILSVVVKKLFDKSYQINKIFLIIYFIAQFLNFIYVFDAYYSDNFIRFNRIILFNQILFPILFGIIISKIKYVTVFYFIFFSSFLISGSGIEKITSTQTFNGLKFENQLNNFGQKIEFVEYQMIILYEKIFPGHRTWLTNYSDPNLYFYNDEFDNFKKEENFDQYYYLSYDLDPMIATYNKLHTLDGYFNLYDQDYKKIFRRIVYKELETNNKSKKYFDDWGGRAYLFFNTKDSKYDLSNINYCFLNEIGEIVLISKSNLSFPSLQLLNSQNSLNFYLIKKIDC